MTAPKNNLQEGKPRISLLPLDLLAGLLCPAYEEGAVKYERDSWRDGFLITVMCDALLRHLTAFMSGEDLDPEAVSLGVMKHHLGAVVFCAISMYDTIINHPELDDRRKHD